MDWKRITVGTFGILFLTGGPSFSGSTPGISDARLQTTIFERTPDANDKIRDGIWATSNANLEIGFAAENTDADGAEVVIKDDTGKEVLETTCDSPLLFTKLPDGNYTVEATAMGQDLEQAVHVPSKGQVRIYFTWKQQPMS
jgi:hypothetical protein